MSSKSTISFFSCVFTHNHGSGDSMGNREVLKRGDLQMTSAGTGIRHSEKAHGEKEVHFLQIWSVPSTSGLSPQYFTRYVVHSQRRQSIFSHIMTATSPMRKRRINGSKSSHPPALTASSRSERPVAQPQSTLLWRCSPRLSHPPQRSHIPCPHRQTTLLARHTPMSSKPLATTRTALREPK